MGPRRSSAVAAVTLAAMTAAAAPAMASGGGQDQSAGNDGDHKVTICHNGHTIEVDRAAGKAQAAHGDATGSARPARSRRPSRAR